MARVPFPTATDGQVAPPHTVFLSYSRVDQPRAVVVLRLLEDAGYPVWWDGLLEGGERFSHATATALDQARAVVVLWSATSIVSHWVHDEATRGRDTGRLIPLSLDGCLPPLGFGQFQSIDVSTALDDPDSVPVQKMLRAVAALHDGQVRTVTRPAVPPDRTANRLMTRRSALIATGAGVIVAGSGLAVWKTGILGGSVNERSVAVLPFENLSGDSEQRYFSDGLTSEIRMRLARNRLLEVVGQTSSESVRDDKAGAASIARKLGAAFLLNGDVQKANGRVKISAELTDGATGLSTWADSYERPLADVFALQAEIGAAVASALSAAIAQPDAASVTAQVGGTHNLAAFDAFLRGRDLYEAGIDEASDRQALAHFDRAIALDADYADAYAARSRSLAIIGNLYAALAERLRCYDAAVVAARKATQLAPAFAEAFSALGFALATGELDMRGARAPYETSFKQGSGSADVLSRYAVFRSHLGDAALAKRVILEAAKLDPLNARTVRSSGDISYAGRDFVGAIGAFEQAIALNPTLAGVCSSLGFAHLLLGQQDAAAAAFAAEKSAVRRLPGQAIIAHRRGDTTAARAALAALVGEYGDKSNYQYAQVYAQWGEPARAMAALQQAWRLRDGGLMLLYVDPLLDPVRATAPFAALARRIGFA